MIRTYEGHTAGVKAVAITPDNKYIVSGSSDKTIRVWNLDSGECVKVIKSHQGEVNAVAVTPEGNSCISAGQDSTLRWWNLENGKCNRIFKGHSDGVNALQLTTDGKYFVSGSSDCTLRLWELHTGKCLRVFDRHPACRDMDGLNHLIRSSNAEFAYHDFLTDLAYSVNYDGENAAFFGHADDIKALAVTKDGKYIISGGWDNTLRLWDLHSGKCLWLFGGHNGGTGGSIHAVAVSSSGKYAISGSITVEFWKISKKNLRRHLWGIIGEKCHRRFTHHEDGINAMAITPKGNKILVACGWKPELYLYKLSSGKRLRTFTGHKRDIEAVAVTFDSRFAVSASRDNTLKLWDLTAKPTVNGK